MSLYELDNKMRLKKLDLKPQEWERAFDEDAQAGDIIQALRPDRIT
ncbi:PIN domain nuclease of toxin-antitoxin system [Rhizobium leguminosarum]|uniref:PIN domain nuclease of toxin-antitoxin system n=1 Tax=Rhizobium leguminosarum TaxID=384 RepID=A0A7Z0E171_RHILE|nr:PIN domain nuclease of toxin-antitoxin system [Rhizobium leguminosarum]